MNCRPCGKNGARRDGGTIGLCWEHMRYKCDGCGKPTLGEKTCTSCLHEIEVSRWRGRAEMRGWDQDRESLLAEIKRERLSRARFLTHEAVEVFYQSMIELTVSIWGAPPKAEQVSFPGFLVVDNGARENYHPK